MALGELQTLKDWAEALALLGNVQARQILTMIETNKLLLEAIATLPEVYQDEILNYYVSHRHGTNETKTEEAQNIPTDSNRSN